MKKIVRPLQQGTNEELLAECKRLAALGAAPYNHEAIRRVVETAAPGALVRQISVKIPTGDALKTYALVLVLDWDHERIVCRGSGESFPSALFSALTQGEYLFDDTWGDAFDAEYRYMENQQN